MDSTFQFLKSVHFSSQPRQVTKIRSRHRLLLSSHLLPVGMLRHQRAQDKPNMEPMERPKIEIRSDLVDELDR